MKWVSIFSSASTRPTDSYRPIIDQVPEPEPRAKPKPKPKPEFEPAGERKPVIPTFLDPKDGAAAARIHYPELQQYLVEYLAKPPPDARLNARCKLARLTTHQFYELSTDVYDELIRRTTNTPEKTIPFLPLRDEFHPKRNQARQKLATLAVSRFQDLSSDVYVELLRRYPEVKEEVGDQ